MSRDVSSRRCGGTGWSGFTLVELLVVISIIGLLVALLLPTLARARSAGEDIQCLAHQRGMNLAMVLHANDTKGWYPVAGEYNLEYRTGTNPGNPSESSRMYFTTPLIRNGYIDNDTNANPNPALRCPQMNRMLIGGTVTNIRAAGHFAASQLLGQPVSVGSADVHPGTLFFPWSNLTPRHWTQFRNLNTQGGYGPYRSEALPSHKVMLADASYAISANVIYISPALVGPVNSLVGAAGWFNPDGATNISNLDLGYFNRHNEGFNVIFFDGSGKLINAKRFRPWNSLVANRLAFYSLFRWCPPGTTAAFPEYR